MLPLLLLSVTSAVSVVTGIVFLHNDCATKAYELSAWLIIHGSMSGLFCIVQLAFYATAPGRLKNLEAEYKDLLSKIDNRLENLGMAKMNTKDCDEVMDEMKQVKKHTSTKAVLAMAYILSLAVGAVFLVVERSCRPLWISGAVIFCSELFVTALGALNR